MHQFRNILWTHLLLSNEVFDEAIWNLYRYYGMVMGVMLMGTHGKFLKVLELTITLWRWRKKWVGSLGRERQVCWDTKRRGKADSLLRESVMKFASWMPKNGLGWRYYSETSIASCNFIRFSIQFFNNTNIY